MNEFSIDGRPIGLKHPPYIIAELSGNHNNSLERALQLIKAAKNAGADAVKLQTYTADTMTLNVEHPRFRVQGSNQWDGDHLYDLYKMASTPWEWHKQMFDYAHEIGITIFSSPFDPSAVELLQSLDAPAYKIASFELVDLELIRLCAATGKPLIMSTGMASLAEIAEAVEVAQDANVQGLVLLKCTSAYPAPPEEVNLRTIPHLADAFGVQAGLSDHTMGLGVPVAAVAQGATVIEKHFTLSRAEGGVDSAFSLEPDELRQLVEESRRAYAALGGVVYAGSDALKRYRRSLFFVKDVAAGTVITDEHVRSIRPGDGLPPKFIDSVVGRTVKETVVRGTPVEWSMLA